MLLEKGASPKQSSALKEAAKFGHTDIVGLLLERGADPDVLETGGAKPKLKKNVAEVIEKKQDQIRQQQQEFTEGIMGNIENPCNITITVVGHKGVGKSCFVKQIEQESIPPGGPGSTDSADFYINYIGYNPNTGFRLKLDENGEMDTGRHRLKRIIDRYRKRKKNDTRQPECEPVHHTKGTKGQSTMVTSTSSSAVKKTGIRQRLKRIIQDFLFRRRHHRKLSSDQRNVIEDIMHAEHKESSEEVKGFVTIYDFGGEEVFYNTHHCFMSSNMIFVLVFDVAMCLDPERSATGYEITEHWLTSIATYAFDGGSHDKRTPPIILVGSHLDQVSSDKEEQEKIFEKVLQKLSDNPQLSEIMKSHVRDMFPIANLNDSTKNQDVYESMWKKIIEIAPLQSQWQKAVPAKWVAFEHDLVMLKKRGDVILTNPDLLTLNSQSAVPLEQREIMDFLRYLKLAGSFLCFDMHSKNPFIVLQPQWIIDAFKAIITDSKFKSSLSTKMKHQWTQYEKSGILTTDFLTQLWEERSIENKEILYVVMETLNLLAKPISDDPNDDTDYFIVPSMLKNPDPERINYILDDPDMIITVTLCLKFNNPFIPLAMWDKMIASCIHRFKQLNEPGYDGLKFIQRGFACLSVDSVWNMIINCSKNTMKLTMFMKNKDKTAPTGAGVNVLCILEFLLQRILEANHQSHLKYQFYLHNDYRFASNDEMVSVDHLRNYKCLPCFSLNGEGWIYRDEIYVWFKDPNHKKKRPAKRHGELTADLPDRKLNCKEIGRLSRYIFGACQMFFVELDCPIEVIEQEMEEHRHLAFRSRITKIFLQLLKAKVDITFETVAEAMSRHRMDHTKLTHIIDSNRETEYEDDRLSDRWLHKTMSVKDVPVVVEHVDIKTYFNLFLELGVLPKTVDDFDDQYRNKPARDKIKNMLKAFITETKPRPTMNTILLAMQECDMDTASLITALNPI
ncbi:uncharacterized protein LOC117317727 isoform X2 [Pecten maximus]|uniref:uncharacterized protein LOC117317727 isoform X2 n=1 Tax=Pecten maximus TaxID=6579 RepID=UPI001457E756|nr:uncharacterized protein LOC117317727 isoform X2 [Pecten maximus]